MDEGASMETPTHLSFKLSCLRLIEKWVEEFFTDWANFIFDIVANWKSSKKNPF